MNWSKGVDANGSPIPDPAKEPKWPVFLFPRHQVGNQLAASQLRSGDGLFYVGTSASYSVFYLTDTDPHQKATALRKEIPAGFGSTLRAIDYQTGKTVWRHDFPAAALQAC